MRGPRTKLQAPQKKRTLFDFNNLTDELLIEILSRLPSSNEAVRCKLVCKRWLSLISSDYFMTSSFIHNRDNNKTLLSFNLVLHHRHKHVEFMKFDLFKPGSSKHMHLEFFPECRSSRYVLLEQSCGDLILCSGANYRRIPSSGVDYYICNVLTGQWIVLPPTPSGRNDVYKTQSVGFLIDQPNCEDNARYNYVVLGFTICYDSSVYIQMFSSDQGEWTKFVVTSPRDLDDYVRSTSLMACGRMLFSLTYKKGGDMVDACVLAFDPFSSDPAQLLHIIDLPLEARDMHKCLAYKLGVCQGRLRFVQVVEEPSRYPCISIWELDYCRNREWTLLYKRIPTNKVLKVPIRHRYINNLISILAFHPNNADLICFHVGNYRVVVYNIQTDEVESTTRPTIFKQPYSTILEAADVHALPTTKQWWPTQVRQPLLISKFPIRE